MDEYYNYYLSESNLLANLIPIVSKCPIKSISKNNNEFGLMIEKMLNISSNELPVADYNGIELKCRKNNSLYSLKLFTSNFESDNLYELEYIFNKLSTRYNSKRTFYHSFFANKYSYINSKVLSKLEIDYKNKKINLCFFDNDKNVINSSCFWSFDLIKRRINIKLNHLCIICYKTIYRSSGKYYQIENINFYSIKDFDTFIQLINDGIIFISSSISTEEKKNGETGIHNHGIGFCIDFNNIQKLFNQNRSITLKKI